MSSDRRCESDGSLKKLIPGTPRIARAVYLDVDAKTIALMQGYGDEGRDVIILDYRMAEEVAYSLLDFSAIIKWESME